MTVTSMLPYNHITPFDYKKPSVSGKGKATLVWKTKNDNSALGPCIECNKSIKKGQIYAEFDIVKKDPYRSVTLNFNFYLHKKCLITFLQDCPFESVEVLKNIDLNRLDNL